MMAHRVVLVGASAGGVEALTALVSNLPGDFGAAILLAMHVPPTARSALPQILSRHGALPAKHAGHGDPIKPGSIMIAPPDRHLLVHRGRVRLSRGPRENGHRPAVDALFRSASRWYGPRVVGVVLSGALDDGTSGMLAVKVRGGVVVAQDPAEAAYASMPSSVIDRVGADHVLGVAALAALLVRLGGEDVPEVPRAPPADPSGPRPPTEDDDMAVDLHEVPVCVGASRHPSRRTRAWLHRGPAGG